MALPTNRLEFVESCLRKLGHPVIKINLDEQQIDDCVDTALQKWSMCHYNGSERYILRRKVTDLDIQNQYVDLNRMVLSGTLTSNSSSKIITGVNSLFLEEVVVGSTLIVKRTGFITTSERSSKVIGVNTTFTTEIAVGDILTNEYGRELGKVKTVDSNTALTLTTDAKLIDSDLDFGCRIGIIADCSTNTSLILQKRAEKAVSGATLEAHRRSDIKTIIRILPLGQASQYIFNVQYQYMLNNYRNFLQGGLAQYNIFRQYMNQMQKMLEGEKSFEFSYASGKLYIYANWSAHFANDNTKWLAIECHKMIDMANINEAWSDEWLRRYTTALLKEQWGTNLKKFSGVTLPGAVQLNGKEIYDEAVAEIAVLIEQLHSEYETPPLFFVG